MYKGKKCDSLRVPHTFLEDRKRGRQERKRGIERRGEGVRATYRKTSQLCHRIKLVPLVHTEQRWSAHVLQTVLPDSGGVQEDTVATVQQEQQL